MTNPNIERDKVEEIRERAEKATPGPWTYDVAKADLIAPETETLGIKTGEMLWSGHNPGPKPHDGNFIAHAREDIPYLLDRLTVSEKRAEEMERERDEARATTLRACQSYSDQVAEIASECDSARSSLMRVREALEQCAERFKEYGVVHMAKEPPDMDKAKRNYEMFDLCRSALQASGDGETR